MTIDAATAAFQAFLDLSTDPNAGAAVLAAYADDAPLTFDGQLWQAATVDAEAFARAWAEAAGPREPAWTEPQLVSLTAEAGDRHVAVFKLAPVASEQVTFAPVHVGQSLFAAVGFRSGWQVGWLALAPTQPAWSYAEGRCQAIADFAYTVEGDMPLPRTSLDAGYYRLVTHPQTQLHERKSVRLDRATGPRCCNPNLKVVLPTPVQAALDALPWPTDLDPTLPPDGAGGLVLKEASERCRFASADGECQFYPMLGRAALPPCTPVQLGAFDIRDATVSARPRTDGTLDPANVARAVASLAQHGFVLLEDVFDPDLMRALGVAFETQYLQRGEEDLRVGSLGLAGGRLQVILDIAGQFNAPEVWANPFLLGLAAAALEPGFLLDSFGCVLAYPGAPLQAAHRDHGFLFPANRPLSAQLPPFMLTVFAPLVDLDPDTGTTLMAVGSHQDANVYSFQTGPVGFAYPRVGSCYVMDYRIVHAGSPNLTQAPRPLLSFNYSRPWFLDVAFMHRHPLSVSAGELEKMAPAHRALFAATPAARELGLA